MEDSMKFVCFLTLRLVVVVSLNVMGVFPPALMRFSLLRIIACALLPRTSVTATPNVPLLPFRMLFGVALSWGIFHSIYKSS